MPRAAKPLPTPTMPERADAAAAARALRAAIADPSTMGEPQRMHIDYGRPRRGEWHVSWSGLPGFTRISGTHIDGRRYQHACLPGWEYARHEIRTEMIPDLEVLAERGVRPTQATSVRAA
ncbi:hypothetical protein [uncultured Methylobacterium sp.]|uniref:hypothetical protein n=1 Tax=uncultured Methylobacterium sp. TaxID=157278 RepID=UPI0035C9F97C